MSLAVPATLLDETGEAIAAVTLALVATHAQHFGLADEIAEDDCAVAGHRSDLKIATGIATGPVDIGRY
jgi:hypothetical protein